MTVAEQQDKLAPTESLEAYIGQWVLLREGRVIDSDLDPGRLLARVEREDDDIVLRVTDHREGVYLL